MCVGWTSLREAAGGAIDRDAIECTPWPLEGCNRGTRTIFCKHYEEEYPQMFFSHHLICVFCMNEAKSSAPYSPNKNQMKTSGNEFIKNCRSCCCHCIPIMA